MFIEGKNGESYNKDSFEITGLFAGRLYRLEVIRMYYASGNYEAFARPKKPAGVESEIGIYYRFGTWCIGGSLFSGQEMDR